LTQREPGSCEPEREVERHENACEEHETPAEHGRIVVARGLFRRKSAVNQVRVYSGPEPPSGGVRRPPLAVIAPHCTQLEGARSTMTVPSASSLPASYTCAGHMCAQSCATSRGTRRSIRMWFGWGARGFLAHATTDDALSKVSLPSGAG